MLWENPRIAVQRWKSPLESMGYKGTCVSNAYRAKYRGHGDGGLSVPADDAE